MRHNVAEVIEKAKIACKISGQPIENHFADARKMVSLGSGAEREIEDVNLTRYACYLIAQNAASHQGIGGTMPKNLPVAEDIVKVGRRLKKAIANVGKKQGDSD